MNLPLTPMRFLERARRIYGDKPFVVCGEERLTYEMFAERVLRMAGALRRIGIRKGDRIAYLGLNCHRLLELYYAVLPLEAILTPLNVRLHPEELLFILNDLEPSLLYVDGTLLPVAVTLRERVPSLRAVIFAAPDPPPPGFWGYEQLVRDGEPCSFSLEGLDDGGVAEIFYTSGTTGRPKGVMLTHRNLYLHALQVIATTGLGEDTVELVGSVPLFHVNAWGSPQYLVALGASAVLTPRFDAERFCQLVERERVTFALFVPTMLNDLLHFPERSRYDLSSLRLILLGGAAAPLSLVHAARSELQVDVRVGYGLTETSPVIALSQPKSYRQAAWDTSEQERRRAMAGLPVVGVEIRVVDAQGREVPHDGQTIGEIEVRGDVVFQGYWRRPEETAAAFRDGFFRTGDMATVDAEGYLQIVDRKKDIIISGGENISSAEIEAVLIRHPAVRECAVVAKPDPRWGEVPFAFVVLEEGTAVDEANLQSFVRAHLAGFKVPQGVAFVTELPKTATGKVQKMLLRRRLAGEAPEVPERKAEKES